jgi:IS5 family transposase
MFKQTVTKETPKQRFCRLANKYFPIQRWKKIAEKEYYEDSIKGGRPPKELEMMLRIMIVKHFYALSEVTCEAEILENLTFREFCLVEDSSEIPDDSTIGRFNRWLVENGYFKQFFEADVEHLKKEGVICTEGTIVDSTITETSKSKKNKETSTDPEAGHTKKGGNWKHGYKHHTGVDEKSGLIHEIHTTAANEADITMAEKCLHGKEIRAWMDSAYLNVKAHIEDEKKRRIKFRVMKRRSSVAKMSEHKQERQRRIQRKIAGVRAKGEHPFGVMKRKNLVSKSWYKGLQNHEQIAAFKATMANFFMIGTRGLVG